MRKGSTAAFVLFFILLPCCAFALDPSLDISQYAHTSWKVRDGFTKGAIMSIAQAPDGYLWLGTDLGLYRFDGVRAIPWQQPAGQQLPSIVISALFSAPDGTLWIGTRKGLASWKDGKLTRHPEMDDQIVMGLLEDPDGTVWAGGIGFPHNAKLCAFRSGGVECNGDDGRLGPGVMGIYQDRKGNLWVGVENGLWRWKPGVPEFFPMPGEMDKVRAFAEDDKGGLLFGSRTGIKRLVGGRVETYRFPGAAQPFEVLSMLRDHDGALWVATRGHGLIHVYKGKADVFSQPDGLTGTYVARLMEDREGTIWAVTLDGLDRFRSYAIRTISERQGVSQSFSVAAAMDGTVWIATLNGLNRWRDAEISLFGSQNRGRADGKLNGALPTTMFQDSSGRLWAPTTRQFGYLGSDRFVSVGDVSDQYVNSIAEVPAGHLWVADRKLGLVHLSEGKIVQQIPWTALGHGDHANVLAADPSGRGLWLGFYEGGIAYFEDGGIRRSYSKTDGLGEGSVYDVRFGPRGTLWAGSEGGLSRVKDGHVSTLTSKNGLPCDGVHWSIEDNDHSVWLQMPCGVVRIAKSELDAWATDPSRTVKADTFDASDGVRLRFDPGGYTPHVAKSPDGTIWFTAYDGVSVIDPRHLAFNKIPPPVHIEQITADDKTYDPANGLRLPARVRDLDIDYTALSLVVPEKVRFRVKLEGQDNDWRELVNVRHVEYTNLPPKHYRFRVLASNNSGVWNEEGAALDFVIPPMWYQTNWFFALCAASFLALLWALYQLRLRQVARQFNVRLEERVSERTRIARDLHDTLLQSFHGLVFRFQAARYHLPDNPEEASEALDSALVSADQALAEGRSAIQELRPGRSQEKNLEQMLLEMGRELGDSQNGGEGTPTFRVIVEGKRRAKRAMIREELYRIARELLRNAYRHAHARSIEAELRYQDDAFLVIVRDDGKGIDPKVLKAHGRAGHWGLPGVYERAEGIGAKLDIWSEAAVGTEVRLRVPAGIAYEKSGDRDRFKLFRRKRIYEHRS